MFMQLLITQLQNQDPTSPMDPSTFVSQLVEVNSLDQVSQINQLLQSTLGSSQSSSSSAGGQ
jgi:flagellar basal-body rod modification protein FlgD